MFLKKAADNSIWPIIMEKAGAKFFGTYERMNGGNFIDAYYPLTGRPGTQQSTTKWTEPALHAKIAGHDKEGDVMWAACTVANAVNLVSGHAYTLLGARAYTDANGVAWNLYHMRNPWGSTEYNGTFSDFDTVNMNAATVAALGHVIGNNDGDFWMTSAEYYKYFSYAGIGQWGDADQYTVVDSVWDRTKSMLSLSWTLNNTIQQDVYVGVATSQGRNFMTDACTTD